MRHLALAGALLLAVTVPALAQPDTQGFTLGLAIHSSHIGAEEESASSPANSVFVEKNGAGVSFIIGYGFTPSFLLRFNVGVAEHDTSDPDYEFFLSSGMIEAMYLFRAGEPLRPYVQGGLGAFGMKSRQDALDFETTGGGVVAGGGFYYFLANRFALDFGLRADFINWDEQTATLTFPNDSTATVETPVEGGGAAAQFHLGGSFWF